MEARTPFQQGSLKHPPFLVQLLKNYDGTATNETLFSSLFVLLWSLWSFAPLSSVPEREASLAPVTLPLSVLLVVRWTYRQISSQHFFPVKKMKQKKERRGIYKDWNNKRKRIGGFVIIVPVRYKSPNNDSISIKEGCSSSLNSY